jgi:hypothetical protein
MNGCLHLTQRSSSGAISSLCYKSCSGTWGLSSTMTSTGCMSCTGASFGLSPCLLIWAFFATCLLYQIQKPLRSTSL